MTWAAAAGPMRLLAGVVAPAGRRPRFRAGTAGPRPRVGTAARNGRCGTKATQWGRWSCPRTRNLVGADEPAEAALERLHSGYVDAFAGDVVVRGADAALEVTREALAQPTFPAHQSSQRPLLAATVGEPKQP